MQPWFNPKDPEIIAKENPFPKLHLKVISRLGDEQQGFTGQVFKVQDANGTFYKLRMCRNVEEAKLYEHHARIAPGMMPRFYGRDGRYLLVEFFEGRPLKKSNLDDCYAMGRLYAEIHQLHKEGDPETQHEKFRHDLKELLNKNILTAAEYAQAAELYEELSKSITHHIALEAFDLNASNFMRSHDRVVFVDEEGMHITFKGAGMVKIFEKLEPDQLAAFQKGYASVASMKFFSTEYELFTVLFMSVLFINDWASKGVPRKSWETRYLIPLRVLLKTKKNPFRK